MMLSQRTANTGVEVFEDFTLRTGVLEQANSNRGDLPCFD
jgi:hypothetical protein